MIEIRIDQTGDTAEAETVEDAMFAARTLLEEARAANPYQGYKPTATFLVDGKAVLGHVPRPAIWRAIGVMRKGELR